MQEIQKDQYGGKKISVFGLVLSNVLNLEFLFGVAIPILIISMLNKSQYELLSIIAAGGLSIAAFAIGMVVRRQLNIFILITLFFTLIGLVGTMFLHDKNFYLFSPIAIDLLLAVIFFGSVIIRKPLVQYLAEYSVGNAFPQELKNDRMYKDAWTILSIIWGLLSLSQMLLRLVLFYKTSTAVYFSISSVYGNISTPLMLVFSFWFPRRYWKSKGFKRKQE